MNFRLYSIGKVVGHPVEGAEWFANVLTPEDPGVATVYFWSLEDACAYCTSHYTKHAAHIDKRVEDRILELRNKEMHGG